MTYAATVLADSPAVYWPLNETSGTTATDLSGNSRPGTYNGSGTLGQPGPGGDLAFECDGTSAWVGTASAVWNAPGLSDYSAEIWVKTAVTTGQVAFTNQFWIGTGITGNYPSFFDTTGYANGTASISDNAWHQVFVKRTGGVSSLYIDGTQVGSVTDTPGSNGEPFGAGSLNNGAGFFWTGSVAVFSYYPAALSDTRITAHYTAGSGGGSNATGYTLAASPSSVATGSPSTITLTITGGTTLSALVATLTDSKSSTISGTITVNNGSTTGTATVNPSATGTHNISSTHTGGGFTGGDGSTSFTATASPTTVPVNNTDLFFSPYTWNVVSSTYGLSVNPGSYLKIATTSTGSGSVTLTLDTTSLNGIESTYCPRLYWTVDGVPQAPTLTAYSASPVSFSLATGLAAGTHAIQVWFQNIAYVGGSPGDRWNTPVSCVKVTGVVIDGGSTIAAPTVLSKRLIVFGDSITEGVDSIGSAQGPGDSDATITYAMILAQIFGAEVGIVAFAAQGYEAAGEDNVPNLQSAYTDYYSGASRLSGGVLSPAPDYLICDHGTNGTTTSSDVQTMLGNFRTIAGPNCLIFLTATFGGNAVAANAAGLAAYQTANPSDTKVYFLNVPALLSTRTSNDTIHPNAYGHGLKATSLAKAWITATGGTAPASGGLNRSRQLMRSRN